MKYICTLCGADFDDDGDAMMHVGFGHKLINSIAETDEERVALGLQNVNDEFQKLMPEFSREMKFGN